MAVGLYCDFAVLVYDCCSFAESNRLAGFPLLNLLDGTHIRFVLRRQEIFPRMLTVSAMIAVCSCSRIRGSNVG